MLAKAEDGVVKAICLGLGTNAGAYTVGSDRCEYWADDRHGVVDDPDTGEDARRLYAASSPVA